MTPGGRAHLTRRGAASPAPLARCSAACAGLAVALALGFALPAQAQVGPSAAEVAAYARAADTPLHAAAHAGELVALRARLAQPDAARALQSRDGHGRTALHVATFARRHEAIRLLVAAGAELGALEADRYDAVTIAAVADDEATLALLLGLGASAGLTTSRWDGTALIAAAHLGHDGVVRQLIAAGAPLDHVNTLHWTALIEAVVLGDGGARHTAVVRDLLAAGANRQLADAQGRTPLDLARERGYGEMVRLLAAGPR